MSAPSSVLFDDLGPRGRRKVLIASLVATIVIIAMFAIAIMRLNNKGQFESNLWVPFTHWPVIKGLLTGLWHTIKAAIVAMAASIVIGAFMALGRLAQNRPIRWLAGIYVEFFRAIPVFVLISISFLGLPQFHQNLSSFKAVVLGLTLYNSAMLAEIFRAGIRSLDRGQTEAATALGLTYWQSMLIVVIPQAGRRMIPAILSQLVALLKDTSLGGALTYVELLKVAQIDGTYYGNLLQMYFVASVVYMSVNIVLSRIARRLEVRQQRRYNASAVTVTGSEELTA